MDRSERNFLGMMSAKGGMDIEEVAVTDPDAIARVHIDPLLGMSDFHAGELVFGAGFDTGGAQRSYTRCCPSSTTRSSASTHR